MGRVGGVLGIILVDAGLVYGSVTALVIVGLLAGAAGVVVVVLLPERANLPLLAEIDEECDVKRNVYVSSHAVNSGSASISTNGTEISMDSALST